jgi:UDP-N-acetylmuramate dehydrogenase
MCRFKALASGYIYLAPETDKAAVFDLPQHFSVLGIPHSRNVPGSDLTTFGIGGPIELLSTPTSLLELSKLLNFLADFELPLRVLGAGSNVLIPDRGLPGVSIQLDKSFSGFELLDETAVKTGRTRADELACVCPQIGNFLPLSQLSEKLSGYWVEDESLDLRVLGASSLMSLSRHSVLAGFSGLEFAAGIPGSIGGAIRMNAGAHGAQMSDIVTEVYSISAKRGLRRHNAKQMAFAYRHCELEADEVVVAATLRLTSADKALVRKKRSECLAYRKQSQPLSFPSAGSVFRNPQNVGSVELGERIATDPAAAELLDFLGAKTWCRGGVRFSDLHANWIVRMEDSAKADDVKSLIERAQKEVFENFGFMLNSEIQLW